MTNTSSRPARFRLLALPATVAVSLLILAGCASPVKQDVADSPAPTPSVSQPSEGAIDPDDNADDETTGVDGPQATISMAGQSLSFTLNTCRVADDDVRVAGPGVDDADGTLAFLDVDIVRVDGWFAGDVFVYLDSDKPSPSAVHFVGTVGGGNDYSMGQQMDGYAIDVNFVSNAGVPIGPGTVLINCE